MQFMGRIGNFSEQVLIQLDVFNCGVAITLRKEIVGDQKFTGDLGETKYVI